MEAEVFSTIGNYTGYTIIAGMFIFILRWVLKRFKDSEDGYVALLKESAEREKKYQEIITQLSHELPEIKESLKKIERNLNVIR